MRLNIRHQTVYSYDQPVSYALQQLRLRPKSRAGQEIVNWAVTVDGGKHELAFEDEHANAVDLVSVVPGGTQITVTCEGIVDVENKAGVVGKQGGHVPLWLFRRTTPLTAAGRGISKLVVPFEGRDPDLQCLHDLSDQIRGQIPFSTDQTESDLGAEDVIAAGHGVCQDHAHVFIAAARALGCPARYVSGYLMMNDRIDQTATHAWAEAHLPELGWVGFDVSNGYSPDDRYVRVATGLDYNQAAPISGMRFGQGNEKLHVELQVQQQ
ncbi:transglutaminase family protein [Yoonia sp. 208BN28-4]|uniref:transglutaminase family protein n=1 Tax=Yoonia sp. 208BN28-4 TaxID=3126505 RepID=UPI0030A23973